MLACTRLGQRVAQGDLDEVAVQRGGHPGGVGVPVQDVERRRRLALQVVVDPVVPDQVVGPEPGEDLGQRARRPGSRGPRDAAIAAVAVRSSISAAAVPGPGLVQHGHAQAQAGDLVELGRSRSGARPPWPRDAARAQRRRCWPGAAPVIASGRAQRVQRPPRRRCPGPSPGAGASGLRQEITNTCWPWPSQVLDHAAARRQVGDVVLVDHRRDHEQRALVHRAGWPAGTGSARRRRCGAPPRPASRPGPCRPRTRPARPSTGSRGGVARSETRARTPRTTLQAAGVDGRLPGRRAEQRVVARRGRGDQVGQQELSSARCPRQSSSASASSWLRGRGRRPGRPARSG